MVVEIDLMSDKDTIEYATKVALRLIRESPLGEELSTDQGTLLAPVIKVGNLRLGEFLLEEGQVDNCLHVLVSGKLEVVKSDQGGEYVTLHVLQPGDMAGELGFIDGTPHSAGIRALGDCEVFNIHRADFEALMERDPDMVYKVMRAIVRAAHRIQRRMNFQYTQLTDYISHQHGRF